MPSIGTNQVPLSHQQRKTMAIHRRMLGIFCLLLVHSDAAVKQASQVSDWSNNIAQAIENFVQHTMSVDSLQQTVNEQPYSTQKVDGTVKTAQGKFIYSAVSCY
jgi:hypothetical protein